ncbi:MAG: zinc dependent phospholipase C family protein [Clostridiales bacterium]|nr:zinc dependent phospholipase C family protein [Candidatus Blautia equi]
MPTTYTHDLFGKKVYKKLPKEMKEVIRENKDLYRIGLHGPDIFFYLLQKSSVPAFGNQMHKECARFFFQEAMAQVREEMDRPLLAYLIGFGCHYLLDSTCHPYVGQMVDEGVITHTLLEKEWDRALMEANGMDPLTSRPSDALVPKMEYAEVIHKVLPLVSVKDIYNTIRMQVFILNRMVYGKKGTMRKIMTAVLGKAKNPDTREITDHFMRREAAPESIAPVAVLNDLFEKALQEAPAELEQLYSLAYSDKELTDRWSLTYNG